MGASFRAGKAAAGLLPTLTETLPRWFEATRHSSFLYVASELIKVFGSNPDLAPELGVGPWLPSPCHPVMIIRYHAADHCKCLIGLSASANLCRSFFSYPLICRFKRTSSARLGHCHRRGCR